METIRLDQQGPVLKVFLNRPDVRNAFNKTLIRELTEVFHGPARAEGTKAVVISGKGTVFSAGGDLNWMKESTQYSKEDNLRDASALSKMLSAINENPVPVVASVHGAALGGGMGLVSVCDYVIASEDVTFGFSEVKLGLIPAVIGPFCLAKIGESQVRSLFLTGERFNALRALQIGLIHRTAKDVAELEKITTEVLIEILASSPQAVRAAKEFIFSLKGKAPQEQHVLAANTLASLRVTKEAQEGIGAFLEKRKPSWIVT